MEKLLLDEIAVVNQYNRLKNVHKVAKHFNVSISPIKRILKLNGVELTNRRYNVNEHYFDDIDTEEKAYWLGFLYADGYIRERKSGDSLEMKLSIKDKSHLELFRSSICSNHKIVDGFNKVNYKGGVSTSHMCCLAIYSANLVKSIKTKGFHSRKTFTIERPNITDDLMNHFIRGYFDGDGSFTFVKSVRNTTGIVSVSPKFREFLMEEIKKMTGIEKFYIDNLRGYLMIQNKIDNNKFYNYIYKNATIFLARKKEKYEEFRRYYKYDN